MQDSVTRLEHFRRFGKEPGIVVADRLLHLYESRGLFHYGRVPYIHVAGTNGKGSVCSFLAAILREAGYKTGLFTSPHLVDFTERIRINGIPIPRERADQIAEEMMQTAEEAGISGGMFDFATVMAARIFEEEQCDIAVIETGLGGKLDATTALGIPLAAVITPIGFDHMQLLGNTLTEIAGEKAGIFKPGVPVVTGSQEAEAYAVLKERAAALGCAFYDAPAQMADSMKLGLPGVYQKMNAAIAIQTAKILREGGYAISDEALEEGLQKAAWPGRFQKISDAPEILVDGAHNSHGVRALHESLSNLHPGEKYHFIMGVLADKDYDEMAEDMADLACRIDTVTPESSRALPAEALRDKIRAMGIPSDCFSSVPEAVQAAFAADADEKICIFGSLYFIGEVLGMTCKEKTQMV